MIEFTQKLLDHIKWLNTCGLNVVHFAVFWTEYSKYALIQPAEPSNYQKITPEFLEEWESHMADQHQEPLV